MTPERQRQIENEDRMIRRLRFLVDLTFATIAQDDTLSLDEAWDHVRALKAAALAMFPGKEQTFDLIYMPRFSRLLAEKFVAN
ncbi:MAG: hypothetical protein M1336_03015 [Deltaproteobacteria bacterium]|nr:hypothetical protein [Deltaproteobacteria bacterium]